MDLPWPIFTLTSLAGAFTLVRFAPEYSLHQSLVQTFFVLISAIGATGLTWRAILWPKLFSPLRHLPGPSGGSFINGFFWRINTEPEHPGVEWINSVPNHGLIRYTSLLNQERLMVTTPQAAAEVLTTKVYDFIKPPFVRSALIRLLGNGLVLAEGEDHKFQRKHLMPAFQYRHIRDLSPIFWSKGTELVKALRSALASAGKDKEGSHQPPMVDLEGWFNRVALDIIGSAGMGQDFGGIENEDSELGRSYRLMFTVTKSRLFMFMLSFLLPQFIVRRIPSAHNDNMREGSEKIQKIARQLIVEKQANLKRQEKRTDVDILSAAMEGGILSEDNLVAQAMTFLAAGHETSATVLSWAVLEMGKHPDIQTRLRDELRANLPPDSGEASSSVTVSPDVIDKCRYLIAFVNEILRFHAPLPITARRTKRETVIAGQRIPKDTEFIVPISAFNRSVEQWGPTANEFDPDRWMEEGKTNNGGAESNYSFMTFLHGPRGCIGASFAKAELYFVLAAFITAFEVSLPDKDAPFELRTGAITVRPKEGATMMLKDLKSDV